MKQSWWIAIFIGIVFGLFLVNRSILLPLQHEATSAATQAMAAKVDSVKAVTEQAWADSVKTAEKKLRSAQIDTLRTLRTGDIFMWRGLPRIVVLNSSLNGRFGTRDVGPQSEPTDYWSYGYLWHYQPNFWIARWSTPKWHEIMEKAWAPTSK